MRRLEFAFGVPLLVLALFVAHEAWGTRMRARQMSRAASYGATRLAPTPVSRGEVERDGKADAVAPAPYVRDEIADVRRRLEVSAPGTYIGDVLAARDSSIARWPDRRTNPLRIWVQSAPKLRGFEEAYVPIVRNAFSEWSESGIPISFTFVLDSASADIRVTWIEKFDETISGKTLWAHDANWWIVDAQIMLALHHKSGEALDSSAVRAIALHEVGHLIGLDHTRDTTAIMTPRVRVKELSASDRATAQLLYALPPGRVGRGR
jgi:hypothetical protein